MEGKFKFAYWAAHGIAQSSRYLLEYIGAEYEDFQYFDDETWGKDKESLGLDFPNLPYVIDGERKLTESSAIIQYIPIRFNQPQLLGGDEWDQIQVKQIFGVLLDVRPELISLGWAKPEEYEKTKAKVITKITPKFQYLEKFLGQKEYFMGYVTFVDFVVLSIWDYLRTIDPKTAELYPGLGGIYSRLISNERIKKYRQSERFPKFLVPDLPVVL